MLPRHQMSFGMSEKRALGAKTRVIAIELQGHEQNCGGWRRE